LISSILLYHVIFRTRPKQAVNKNVLLLADTAT
jgi:hypothetical protein